MQILENPKWQPYAVVKQRIFPQELQEWIAHPGSFMLKLQQHGIHDASINVLNEHWRTPMSEEKDLLKLKNKEKILAREVMISSDEIHWMAACTIFPADTLTGEERQLADLQNRSLGSVLFKDPSLTRSAFEVKQIETEFGIVWTRRSLFSLKNKMLLLSEQFLPDMCLLWKK